MSSLCTTSLSLAVDDFGTGYSSLSYLRQFPIDTLKVDQSFIHEINAETDEATIISAVINMGCHLKHRVIAEGVETADSWPSFALMAAMKDRDTILGDRCL
jgi:EAL domain-containing protein (putative c-di-GMP-specific phosphodiesterase class I)